LFQVIKHLLSRIIYWRNKKHFLAKSTT
jgi:hypothetical protein